MFEHELSMSSIEFFFGFAVDSSTVVRARERLRPRDTEFAVVDLRRCGFSTSALITLLFDTCTFCWVSNIFKDSSIVPAVECASVGESPLGGSGAESVLSLSLCPLDDRRKYLRNLSFSGLNANEKKYPTRTLNFWILCQQQDALVLLILLISHTLYKHALSGMRSTHDTHHFRSARHIPDNIFTYCDSMEHQPSGLRRHRLGEDKIVSIHFPWKSNITICFKVEKC